ncbi:MAG: cbb3-type cytochrome c oxidase subunit I [Thermoleophilia bacterium]|nr:cbb3-type cytochrome c oxidase subunit I [Thermoleophilia bacterium]
MSSTTQPAADWHRGRVASWLVSIDHKRIGALYLGCAGVFFVIAGVLTLLIRLQMTRPDASILGSGTYRGVLTMHGTLLVFFVLLPVVTGLATYIVPLMIGARTIALPGSAAVALWLFVFGGAAVTLSAFAGGGASQAGWTGLPPLALSQQGNGVDLWLMGLLLLAISLLLSAANLIATIRGLRMDGMEWSNTPMFAWAVYVWSWLSIVLVPIAALGLLVILLERSFSGSFDFFLDGDTVEPKLIWLFGQSFAYAALVPIFGILAELVAVFAGRAVANARLLGQALVGIGGLTIALVLYHTYSTGVGSKPSVVLLLLAVVATIPSVVALWLLKSTLWTARASLRFTAPLLFAGGAIVLFGIGLLSALVLAIFGNDRGLRGTAFGVAHAHYLLWGTALLAMLGGVVYWWPKVFGRLLGQTLTRWAAILLFIGFNCTFFVQFLLGDQGQARGATSFSADGSTSAYNTISTIGAFVTALGAIFFLLAVLRSRSARRAGNDPWLADTIEWYTTSPPPPHNFDSLPKVTSARPLADLREAIRTRNAI